MRGELSSIVLFFHHENHFVKTIESGTIFFLVIVKGFTKPQKGDSAFMLDSVTHLYFFKNQR